MIRRTIVILAVCLLCGAVAYARYAEWKKTAKPPLSLRSALDLAEAELRDQKIEYYCIGARLANTFRGGDWEFHFSSKDGKEMWVSIGSDKQPRNSDEAFQY